MEVEITTKDLIGTLAREYHLDTHRLDDTSQQIHRRRGAEGGDIVGFDEIDDVAYGVETFLDGVVDFVVDGANMVGHEFGLCQIWRTLQSYGKGVQTGPVGFRLGIVLDTHLRVFLSNGGNDGRIQTTRKQHAVWHI